MPFLASTLVIAAVSVVLPWSTCPIVPTFTCGLLRSNFSFDMVYFPRNSGLKIRLSTQSGSQHFPTPFRVGAHDRNRTGDLVLTKDVLYRLSYVGGLTLER